MFLEQHSILDSFLIISLHMKTLKSSVSCDLPKLVVGGCLVRPGMGLASQKVLLGAGPISGWRMNEQAEESQV